MTGTPR